MIEFLGELVASAYTGRSLKRSILMLGLAYPARVTDMYLAGESPDYIVAAVLAVNQSGA